MAVNTGIIRVQKNKENPYTMMNKTGLQDNRLSWKAKGLLAYLLSLPDDWKIYLSELETHAIDGRDSLRSGINELIKYGYIERERMHDEKGKFSGYNYCIYEVPPVNGKPVNGKSENGKSVTTNKRNKQNNKNTNKQQQEQTELKQKDVVVAIDQEQLKMIKNIIPKEIKVSKKDISTIIETAKNDNERIKKNIEAFLCYAKGKNIDNPIGAILKAIKENWTVSKFTSKRSVSTLKNFEEEKIDYDKIMKVHNALTAKDLFED